MHIPVKWLCCMLFFSLRQLAGFFPDAHALQTPAAAAENHIQQTKIALFDDTAFTRLAAELLADEAADDNNEILRTTAPKGRKQRYYLNATTQQFSCSPRILYLDERQYNYILEKENKSGVYQWQDSFRPAYYNFLFRLALF